MKTYPILYTFRELVSGDGFWAGVALHGRALAVQESECEWWAYGVNPGAIAAKGSTLNEAFAELQTSFRKYLHDCSKLFRDFDGFRTELERFYSQADDESLADWEEAVQAMRAGGMAPAGLAKQPADRGPAGIDVQEILRPKPLDGSPHETFGVAA